MRGGCGGGSCRGGGGGKRLRSHGHANLELLRTVHDHDVAGRPLLVNVVSKRVRQLSAGHRPMIDVGPKMGWSDIALMEIIDGKLGFEMKSKDEEKK